jgi:hypothetical protein
VLAREGTITRALIIDLDVHQGDGTADCLSGEPHSGFVPPQCPQLPETIKAPAGCL